jgi:hypothetical protein
VGVRLQRSSSLSGCLVRLVQVSDSARVFACEWFLQWLSNCTEMVLSHDLRIEEVERVDVISPSSPSSDLLFDSNLRLRLKVAKMRLCDVSRSVSAVSGVTTSRLSLMSAPVDLVASASTIVFRWRSSPPREDWLRE